MNVSEHNAHLRGLFSSRALDREEAEAVLGGMAVEGEGTGNGEPLRHSETHPICE